MNNRLELFLITYRQFLLQEITKNPQDYSWKINEFDFVFERMRQAILKGSYNKDSIAFKNTCKELKIKHTYKSITEFIK